MEATASSSSWLETSCLPSDRRKAIEELIKGRELALQLRNLIPKSAANDGSQQEVIISQDIVANILSSFTNSLSILKNGDADEVSQVETHTQFSSLSWEAYLKPEEDSGESSKSSTIKDRRGRYKRRKCVESWKKDSSTLVDDGYAWRKYGQKVILNAKFPRNYFRCTHKFDQGCQATKQVQRIVEEPQVYRTTYIGHHTCKTLLKASQFMLDSTCSDDQHPMISFCGTHHHHHHNPEKDLNPFFPSFQSIKQESKDNDRAQPTSGVTRAHNNQSSSSDDYLVSPEFTAFETSNGGGHMTSMFSSGHHGDVISGVNSSSRTATASASDHGLDISGDFDDVLEFDF